MKVKLKEGQVEVFAVAGPEVAGMPKMKVQQHSDMEGTDDLNLSPTSGWDDFANRGCTCSKTGHGYAADFGGKVCFGKYLLHKLAELELQNLQTRAKKGSNQWDGHLQCKCHRPSQEA